MDKKRDEVVGNTGSHQSMTTAIIVVCPEIPLSGLTQDMHDPSVLLDFRISFLPGITGEDGFVGTAQNTTGQLLISTQITQYLITDCIARIHPTAVDHVFKGKRNLFPRMPVIDRIQPGSTEYYQFGAIFEDEGTITGTMGVHDSIFLKQLNLNPTRISRSGSG